MSALAPRPVPWTASVAAAFAVLAAIAPTPSHAAPILLEDGVAFLEIDPESPDGATGWTVNGVAHVRTQQLWIRAGDDGSETSLDALDLVSAVPSDADGDGHDETLAVLYADPAGRFDLALRWILSGSPIAPPSVSASSNLVLDVTVGGHVPDQPPFEIFHYIDVDLFGSFADDDALFDVAGHATVTDSSALGSYEAVWLGAPESFEAALYDTTLASLTDGAPTVLSNALGASGDVTLAAAWTGILGEDRKSYTNRWTQSIRVVPEPGTALLLAFGVAIVAARRREDAR